MLTQAFAKSYAFPQPPSWTQVDLKQLQHNNTVTAKPFYLQDPLVLLLFDLFDETEMHI